MSRRCEAVRHPAKGVAQIFAEACPRLGQIDEKLVKVLILCTTCRVGDPVKHATVRCGHHRRVNRVMPMIEAVLRRTAVRVFDIIMIGEKRSEEHTSELQSLMRISYAVFCLKKKK